MAKLHFLLILILGISSCTSSKKAAPPLNAYSFLMIEAMSSKTTASTPSEATQLAPVQHKISHTISYYDYSGPTREITLHFDSTGGLIARSRGSWIRNLHPAPADPTIVTIYSTLNPAPNLFYRNNREEFYYYNALKKSTKKLPYNKLVCDSEGLVGVGIQSYINTKYAFLDKEAKPICDFIYDVLYPFNNGIAIVERARKQGVLNATGKEIIPCSYQSIKILDDNKIEAKKANQEIDFFDREGKLINEE